MKTHQVEVDDEVFALVKSQAEPLVDSFNTVIRRLLSLDRRGTRAPSDEAASAAKPSFPGGTPQALRQILEVVRLMRAGTHSRPSATRLVATQYEIAPQTVLDKYARQLGLTTRQFDHLLENDDQEELKHLLKSKFGEYSAVIDDSLR